MWKLTAANAVKTNPYVNIQPFHIFLPDSDYYNNLPSAFFIFKIYYYYFFKSTLQSKKDNMWSDVGKNNVKEKKTKVKKQKKRAGDNAAV